MANRKIMVQISPRVILVFPSTISSAPIDTSLTPLLAMKSSALLTFAILWKRIFPRSGLGSVSPEMTSRRSINFNPFLKSSSMFSICVPAFLRCELHHAVNVYKRQIKDQIMACVVKYIRHVIPLFPVLHENIIILPLPSQLRVVMRVSESGSGSTNSSFSTSSSP